jgi:hypothetical protein
MVFAGSPVDPLANKSSGSLPIVRDVYHKPKLTLNWYVPLASATDAPGLSGDNQREAKDKQEDENHGCLARREWKLPLMVKEGQSGILCGEVTLSYHCQGGTAMKRIRLNANPCMADAHRGNLVGRWDRKS